MKKRSSQSIFNGTQGQMYAVLVLLWQHFLQRLPDFADNNAKYTQQLADDQQEAIIKARDMPNVAVRRAVPKEARTILTKNAIICTNNWQSLSSLIESSYAPEEWDIKKELAGYGDYKAATSFQWDAVVSLTTAGVNFINDNTDDLTRGGMLPGFPDKFAQGKKAFDTLYTEYFGIKKNFNKQTTEKAKANNALYQTAMGLMNDAKKIYRNDAPTRAEFTYSSLMQTVRGKGFTKTGCCFAFLEGSSTTPVTTATVLITSGAGNQAEKATERGTARYELAAGTYQFTITAPGFNTMFGTIKVKDGTMHQKTLRLTKGVSNEEVTTPIVAAI